MKTNTPRLAYVLILAFLFCVAIAAAQTGAKAQVPFRFHAPGAQNVFLAGSFNEWSTSADKMAKSGDDFSITKELGDGEYQYKFVVNGTDWKPDPNNSETSDDTYGGKNSVVKVKDGKLVGGRPPSPTSSDAGTTASSAPMTGKSLEIKDAGRGKYQVTFRYQSPSAAKVYLAGSFNGWNAQGDEMTKAGNVFSFTREFEEGEYQYKFVENGTEWKQDPLNPEGSDDGNGGMNSVLKLGAGATASKSEEKVGDGKVNPSVLSHDPNSIEYFNPQVDGSAIIKVRASDHDVSKAELVPSAQSKTPGAGMKSEFSDDKFEYFRAHVPLNTLKAGAGSEEKYTFLLSDGETHVALGADGPTTTAVAKPFEKTVDSQSIFATPEWARHVVWYEIYPERFRNGTKANDPKTSSLREWRSDWFKPGPNENNADGGPGIYDRMYGGDMQGCIEELPYLKSLGVGAIWFNPVFQSVSNHKYNATDYRHVDEHFGFDGDYAKITAQEDLLDPKSWKFSDTDKLFLEFVKKAHAAGIKVILDGVFNHTGPQHPAFQDLIKNGRNSKFANWYNVTNWDKPWVEAKTPFTYEGWFGGAGLPVFKEDKNGYVDPEVRKHIKAVTRRWMDPNGDGDPSDGVDGWRLDVPNEVSSVFWREWRQVVKSVNPNGLIMGEIWDQPAKWVQGDQFDCVMNYENCAKPLIRFWADGNKPSKLAQDIAKYRHSVPDQSQYVMMNLMNSHDTDRLASMLNNPGRGYDQGNRLQDAKGGAFKYDMGKPSAAVYAKMKALVAMQFCYIGGPMIYYGDEAGMWGADDPQDRKPMIWKDLEPYEKPEENHFEQGMFDYYQRCAAIRDTLPSLQTGDYELLLADDAKGVIAFRRWSGKENVIVVSNNSQSAAKVELPLSNDMPKSYINLVNDPGVKTVPGDIKTKASAHVEIGNKVKGTKANDSKLDLSVEPMSTQILLGR